MHAATMNWYEKRKSKRLSGPLVSAPFYQLTVAGLVGKCGTHCNLSQLQVHSHSPVPWRHTFLWQVFLPDADVRPGSWGCCHRLGV